MSRMGTEVIRQQELRAFLQDEHDYERALEEENERLRFQIKLMVGKHDEEKKNED
jgi:hypothetical protein